MTFAPPTRARALSGSGEAAAEEADRTTGMSREGAARCGDRRVASTTQDRQQCVAQGGEELRSRLAPDLTPVLAKQDVPLPVPALDRPMATNKPEQHRGIGLVRCVVGDEVPGLGSLLVSGRDLPVHFDGLLDTREGEMTRELVSNAEASLLAPTMLPIDGGRFGP